MANLTSQVIRIPFGTIVATIENFDEKEYETLEWTNSSDSKDTTKSLINKNSQIYLIKDGNPNQYLYWKPIKKHTQDLKKVIKKVIDSSCKLIQVVETNIEYRI